MFNSDNKQSKKALIYSAIMLEKILKKTTSATLFLAEKSDQAALSMRRYYSSYVIEEEPSLRQWVNRLIEHVDSKYIIVAYHYFMSLIEAGVSPDSAFEEVVGSVY